MSDIEFDQGRFWVCDHPTEDGEYLIAFPLYDMVMKHWADGMNLEPFHDQPSEQPDEHQWMVVGDRKTVATFKLVWGGK